jgi:hypothetical protein
MRHIPRWRKRRLYPKRGVARLHKRGATLERAGRRRINREVISYPILRRLFAINSSLRSFTIRFQHEMAHPIERTHSDRFIAILNEHFPTWREARAELNELPLTLEVWKE